MIRQTSIAAYNDMKPIFSKRHREYLDALRKIGHPATDQEVSRFSGHNDPNYFRPRRYELFHLGFITEAGKRTCAVSGKKAMVWWFIYEPIFYEQVGK